MRGYVYIEIEYIGYACIKIRCKGYGVGMLVICLEIGLFYNSIIFYALHPESIFNLLWVSETNDAPIKSHVKLDEIQTHLTADVIFFQSCEIWRKKIDSLKHVLKEYEPCVAHVI